MKTAEILKKELCEMIKAELIPNLAKDSYTRQIDDRPPQTVYVFEFSDEHTRAVEVEKILLEKVCAIVDRCA